MVLGPWMLTSHVLEKGLRGPSSKLVSSAASFYCAFARLKLDPGDGIVTLMRKGSGTVLGTSLALFPFGLACDDESASGLLCDKE